MESHCEAEHTEGRIPKPSVSQTGWDPFARLTSSPGPLQAFCPCCFPLYFTRWSLGLAPDYACRYLFPPHKMPLTQNLALSALALRQDVPLSRLESPLPTSDSAVPVRTRGIKAFMLSPKHLSESWSMSKIWHSNYITEVAQGGKGPCQRSHNNLVVIPDSSQSPLFPYLKPIDSSI